MLEIGPEVEQLRFYDDLRDLGMLDKDGILNCETKWAHAVNGIRHFRTSTSKTPQFNFYMKQLAEKVFSNVPIVDITNRRSVSEIKSILTVGKFFYLQAGLRHKELSMDNGHGDKLRQAYYQRRGFKMSFVYDPWDCTSTSARSVALSGHSIANPICMVKSIESGEDCLTIDGSCYAIGINFADNQTWQIAT